MAMQNFQEQAEPGIREAGASPEPQSRSVGESA